MADLFRTCRDGHRCENGATCQEDPVDEGSYYCDCTTATGDYAGLFCEFQAENYCSFSQEMASSWFCTNRGTCEQDRNNGENSWKCACLGDYEGPHCEYISGAVPESWPNTNGWSSSMSKKKGDPLEGGIIAAITVSVLVFVALVAYVVVSKYRKSSGDGTARQNAPADPTEALNIEMDGTGLREQTLSAAGSNASSKSNGNAYFTSGGFEIDGSDTEMPGENVPTSTPQFSGEFNGSTNGNGHSHKGANSQIL